MGKEGGFWKKEGYFVNGGREKKEERKSRCQRAIEKKLDYTFFLLFIHNVLID